MMMTNIESTPVECTSRLESELCRPNNIHGPRLLDTMTKNAGYVTMGQNDYNDTVSECISI
jgi:hypothetical protein